MNTAIILAARKEKDCNIPYPIQPFADGINLIDRSLQILRNLNFNNIIIVVGYEAELFKRYMATDTTIVVNSDYEYTSSMASLATCRDLISTDFLLIEGDTFFEIDVVAKLSAIESGNCLSITEESGSGDECFVETKNNFITKITKDRHRVCNFEGELMGISRISLPTFKRMLELWDSSSNPAINYEYLLMDATEALDRPYILFKNTIWGDVDCKEDFKRLQNSVYRTLKRKEDPYDEENIINYVHSIFPQSNSCKINIKKIGGMSNKNFRIDIDGNSYILRIPGNGSEGMVERINEEFNAKAASDLGINPAIRYFNNKTGIKLADYIENSETLNAATIQRFDNMRKIAEIYRTLHNSRIRLKNEFNIFQEIEKYNILLKKANARMYEGWEEVYPKILKLESYLNSLGVDLKPCHNDALYENFIKDSFGKIYLIDWEYSGMNDPMADFAALFLDADFEQENQNYILDEYFGHPATNADKEKILCYQILWDYLWSQWTVIKEAKGDDFGTYGPDRFKRAANNLNKLHNNI